MKIDRRKIAIRCGYDEPECKALADRLASITDNEILMEEISKIRVWTYGKCELGLWADILDRFDSILEEAVKLEPGSKWTLKLDSPDGAHLISFVIKTLEFTGHLIEHSIYRYMYGSLDHVMKLFNSSNMDVVLSVLGLFYTFSKRSNYFARLEYSKKHEVASRLEVMAESWGGKENNFGLRECCSQTEWPKSASTLHFEYYDEAGGEAAAASSGEGPAPTSSARSANASGSLLRSIHLEKLHLSKESPHRLMEGILKTHLVPESKRVALFARLRLARYFSDRNLRAQCLKARLQAISILCYNFDTETRILYRELMEELVDVLELPDEEYRDMKASVMRTLTAIVHSGKRYYSLELMMETTGMNSYPGVVPSMVHRCVQDLVDGKMEAPSGSMNQQFTTALLSFLYHLACFEEQETYPLSTGGTYRSSLATGYLIDAMLRLISWRMPRVDYLTFATRAVRVTDQILNGTGPQHHMPILSALVGRLQHEVQANPVGQYAILSRSALMKSIINLIKRIIAETDWSSAVTTMMENSRIPDVVLAIIKRPNDFPAPLYLNSLELITNYIYQNPSRLSTLQERGLTDQIIDVLHEHPLPVSREVLISLAQVLSMLVLNDAGATAIINSGIVEKFLNCLVDETYLQAMKLRRMRDSAGQTSTPHQMGYTLDELIRCHNMMRMPCVTAMVGVLRTLVEKGRQLSQDIEVYAKERDTTENVENGTKITERRRQFMDITFNVLKFFESFINTHGSQQQMPDLLRDLVVPLLFSLIQLPCLPVDFHTTNAASMLGTFMRSLTVINAQPTGAPPAAGEQSENGTEMVWNELLNFMLKEIESCDQLLHEETVNELLTPSDVSANWPPRSHLLEDYLSNNGESKLVRQLSVVASMLFVFQSMASQVSREQRRILVRLWNGWRGTNLCSHLRALMNSLTLELGMLVHYLLDKEQRNMHPAWKALTELHSRLPKSTVNVSVSSTGDQTRPNPSSLGEDLRQPILTSEPGPERLALYIASSLMSDGLHLLFAIFRSFFPLQSAEVIIRYGDQSAQVASVTPEERVLAHMIRLCGRTLNLASNVCVCLARLAVGNLNFASFRRRQATSSNPPAEQCKACTDHLGSLLRFSLAFKLPYRRPRLLVAPQPQLMETETLAPPHLSETSVVPLRVDSWEDQLELKLNFTLSFFSLRLVSLLLCEQAKVPYHLLLNAFQSTRGHDALFDIFHNLFGHQWEDWCKLEERSDVKLMGMHFLERWLICIERFTNADFLTAEGDPPGSGVFDDITRCPSFKVDRFLQHTHWRFLSVLHTMFATPPAQTISMLAPKAQECLVTIMLHMAHRAKKMKATTPAAKPETASNLSTSAATGGATTTVTASANALAAALQSAAGVMSSSGPLGSSSSSEQLMAAMEAAMSASFASAVAGTVASRSSSGQAAVTPSVADVGSSSEAAGGEAPAPQAGPSSGVAESEASDGATAAAAAASSEARAQGSSDEIAHLMDMFPSVPRDLVMSALVECHGDLQEATETLLLASAVPSGLSPHTETIPSPPPPPLVPPMLPPALSAEAPEPPSVRPEAVDVTVKQLVEFLPNCLRLTRGKMSKQVCLLISELFSTLDEDDSLLKQIFSDLVAIETPQASYNFFVALQFTRNRFSALELACSSSIPRKMIQQLERAMSKGIDSRAASNQVTSACLILDQIERTQPALALRRDTIRLMLSCREWRVMDEKNLRWNALSNNANRSISGAFHDGAIQHRYMDIRRQEIVNFVTFSRYSHSSVTRRPIQPWSRALLDADPEVSAPSGTLEPTPYEQRLIDSPELCLLNQSARDSLFHLLVSFLLNRPAASDWKSLDAVLRLLLRLTSREYNYASQLADLHVYESLLTAQVEAEYVEYPNMVALLLRQIFEDPVMIEDCITDILRHAILVGLESKSLEVQVMYRAPCQFDLLYVVSQLGPLMARDLDTTVRVASERLSLQLEATWIEEGASDKQVDAMKHKFLLRNQLLDDPKVGSRSETQSSATASGTPAAAPLGTASGTSSGAAAGVASGATTPTGPAVTTPPAPGGGTAAAGVASPHARAKIVLSERQKGVLRWLLDHLVAPDDPAKGAPGAESDSTNTSLSEMDTSEPGGRQGDSPSGGSAPKLRKTAPGPAIAASSEGANKRQLQKVDFLLFLTEMVRCYSPVADFVASYQCSGDNGDYQGSALAILIDRYLMDSRLSELTGNLIGWLVRAVHSPEAQSMTVNEVKAALRRATDMMECRRKHELLQAIAKLLDKIVMPLLTHVMNIYNNPTNMTGRGELAAHVSSNMLLSSVLRVLYKKQIGRDLARVPVALDMNSPRATETAVRIVKTLETLTRINKITSVNSLSNSSASHRRRHPAQHYHAHLRHDGGSLFRTLPYRRVRTFARTATVESMESIIEPTSTDGMEDLITPILTIGTEGTGEAAGSNSGSRNAGGGHDQAAPNTDRARASSLNSLEQDRMPESGSGGGVQSVEGRLDNDDLVDENALVNQILDDDEDEDIMVEGDVSVSIFAREHVGDDEAGDHVMLEADDDGVAPTVGAFDDAEEEDDDVEEEEDDEVEDVRDDVVDAEGEEVEEEEDDDSDSDSSDDPGHPGYELAEHYRTGDGEDDDDDDDFDEDEGGDLGAAEGVAFHVPMQVSGDVVFPEENAGSFSVSANARHIRTSSMEAAEIRNLLEEADMAVGGQRNFEGAVNLERIIELLSSDQRYVENTQRQQVFLPQHLWVGPSSGGPTGTGATANSTRPSGEGSNSQQSNRAYVHINSQHESLRHTTDTSLGGSSGSGTGSGATAGGSGAAGANARGAGLGGNPIYRWPNRGFSQVLTGSNYEAMMGGAFQMNARSNNGTGSQQDGSSDPMSAQEGDVAMWMHLKEQESVAGGSVAVSLLERPSLPPLTYRRWIELARVLFGREISDLILLGREKIVPAILSRRKQDFDRAVAQRKEEKEKEKLRVQKEKEAEDKRQSERAEKMARLSEDDDTDAHAWAAPITGSLTEAQEQVLRRQTELLLEVGNLRERAEARRAMSMEGRDSLRERLLREVDPVFMRMLAVAIVPSAESDNRRMSTQLLHLAFAVLRVMMKKLNVDASIRLRLDEALFTMGIVTDINDLRVPEGTDLANSNLDMLLTRPSDAPAGSSDQEGLGAVLRLVRDHFRRPPGSECVPEVAVESAEPAEEAAAVEPEPEVSEPPPQEAAPVEPEPLAAPPATPAPSGEATGEDNAAARAPEGNVEGLLHRVDPSFLSALPEDLRREVIADEVRSGIRQHMATRAPGETPVISEQFLSALPEHIQEEVNAQFRRVTANLAPAPPAAPAAAAAAAASAVFGASGGAEASASGGSGAAETSGETVVPGEGATLTRHESATFLDTLSPELRRDVLTDMDDSQIAALPQAVANEARQLRLENEQRTVRMYQQRAYHQAMSAQRYQPNARVLHAVELDGFRHITRQMRNLFPSMVVQSPRQFSAVFRARTPRDPITLKCKQFVDQEGLTCLLALLVRGYSPAVSLSGNPPGDLPTSAGPGRQLLLCTSVRRLLRNLAYHSPTRHWLLRALLSILHSAAAAAATPSNSPAFGFTPTIQAAPAAPTATTLAGPFKLELDEDSLPNAEDLCREGATMETEVQLNSLLTMSYPVALGCRVPFFIVTPSKRPHGSGPNVSAEAVAQEKERASGDVYDSYEVRIHPRVAAFVCKTMLETLADLGQCFYEPLYPSPMPPKESTVVVSEEREEKEGSRAMEVDVSSPKPGQSESLCSDEVVDSFSPRTDFWRLLLRLDRAAASLNQSGLSAGIIGSPTKSLELSACQGTPAVSECAFVSVASLILHDGLYRRQELLETILKLLDEILNKFKVHTENKRLNAGIASSHTRQAGTSQARQTRLVRFQSWLLRPDQAAGEASEAATEPSADGSAAAGAADAVDVSGPSEAVAQPDAPPAGAEAAAPSKKTSPPDGMETLPKTLLRRIAEVLLCSPLNEWAMRHALNLVKTLSRLNARNRQHLFDFLMEGVVALATLLTGSLERLSHDLVEDQERRAKQKTEERSSEAEAMDTDSPVTSTSVVTPSGSSDPVISADSRSASTAATRVMNRFQNGETVVIVGERQPQSLTSDLQLVSLVPFTTKGSAQYRFVKILNLVNTIRPDAEPAPDAKDDALAPLLSCIDASGMECIVSLWRQLSRALTLLEDSADPRAVLLLQPCVEAFFLAHAKPKPSSQPASKQPRPGAQGNAAAAGPSGAEARPADQLAHLNLELGPVSPLPGPGEVMEEAPEAGTKTAVRELKPSDWLQQAKKGATKDPLFLFAERHRTVLNQILRQQTNALVDGPFSQLINHPKVLDFDVKRNYIHTVLSSEHSNASSTHDEEIVQVNRARVFEDSFARLHRKSPAEWKNRFYIIFNGEEGQDAGGLLREWYQIIARESFNPNYALFCNSSGNKSVYTISPSSYINSNHLSYFKFVGRIMAKAIYDQQLLECYFTRSFYKHILGIPVKVSDMENEDYDYHKSLMYMLENDVAQFELTFSTEVNEFGRSEIREFVENGSEIHVTDENKSDYVRLLCQEKMTGAIRQQLNAFLEGFYDIIPKSLISIFNEQELELLISGLPNMDVDDLMVNTEYNKYTSSSMEIQWFWRALRSFEQEDRARFLQFVTGTSKVPLGGFSNLHVLHGPQKFQIHKDTRGTDRLPTAHTCFNQLDLPPYETYDKLRSMLLTAIRECSEGFGFA